MADIETYNRGRLPKCVDAFILAVLCGNPILKGAWITLLNSIILRLSQEVDLLLLQITRANAAHRLLSLLTNTVAATVNQVKVDLNLFLGPLQQFSDCLPLKDLNTLLQNNAVGKKFNALKKLEYKVRRMASLASVLTWTKEKKEEQITILQDFIDKINELC